MVVQRTPDELPDELPSLLHRLRAKTDAGARAWIAVDTEDCFLKTIGEIASQTNS
jgi:hypothetical protein